jgi:hypothetical protein
LDDRTEAFLQAIPPVIDGQDPLIVPPVAGLLISNIFFHFTGFNFINSRFPKIFPEGCTAFPVERGAGRKTEVILSPVKYGVVRREEEHDITGIFSPIFPYRCRGDSPGG